MPIYADCNAQLLIVGDEWRIILNLPKILYDSIMAEEKDGQKTAVFPVKLILRPERRRPERR